MNARCLSILLAILFLFGCSNVFLITQKISGDIKFPSNNNYTNKIYFVQVRDKLSCEGEMISSVINNDGHFEFDRRVDAGKFEVRVQHDALCVVINNSLQVIWVSTYGPASKELKFECNLHEIKEQKCKAVFNGQYFDYSL